jgi:lysophospholipase L1-like esterase
MIRKTYLVLIYYFFAGQMIADNPKVIVCFGNSYTEGMGASSLEAYPSRLEKTLKGISVINAGVSGETAEKSFLRIERDVLSKKPDLVIVEFGVNEAFRGYPVEEALVNIERIVQKIISQGSSVIIVGVHFGHFHKNFDQGLEVIAAKHKTGLVLDALHGILDNSSLRSDSYHPNAEGYRILAERILPEVKKFIGNEHES